MVKSLQITMLVRLEVQKVQSQQDMVIGSKTAGVPTFNQDFFRNNKRYILQNGILLLGLKN